MVVLHRYFIRFLRILELGLSRVHGLKINLLSTSFQVILARTRLRRDSSLMCEIIGSLARENTSVRAMIRIAKMKSYNCDYCYNILYII